MGNQGSPTCMRGREGIQDACEAIVTRANAATRGAESCDVGDRHGHAQKKDCGASGCEKSVLPRSRTKESIRRITT